MTNYQKLQQQIARWDCAVADQSNSLVNAASNLAKHFPAWLGVTGDPHVWLGVGTGDHFRARWLDDSDCAPGGSGSIDFTVRVKVLPNNDPADCWLYDLQMRISITAAGYGFQVLSQGLPIKDKTLKPIEVQTGAFAEVYSDMITSILDTYDPARVQLGG